MCRYAGLIARSTKLKSALAAAALGLVAVLALPSSVNAASDAGAEPSQAKHGGNLNWIVTPEPASVIPLTTTAGTNAELGPKIVEGLLTYDDELNPLPLLATDWDISDDGLQYTFRLRKGVKWHDGANFTSEDVAFSLMTLKEVHPRGRAIFANVSEVKTPDEHTAVVVLSKPAPYLITALAGAESPIVPKHLYENTDIVANKYNSAPI